MKTFIYLLILALSSSCFAGSHSVQISRGAVVSGGVAELTMRAVTSSTASGSTITINVPTNSNSDLLTLSVVNDDGGSITTPSGWNLQGTQVASTSIHNMYSRVASSEPGTYTITNNTSGSLVAVMTSWQKPSGTWTITAGMAYRLDTQITTPYMNPTNNSMIYVGFPNDSALSVTGGPYTGYTGSTPATNMVALTRAAVGTISIDTYYEPSDEATNIQRNVVFSGNEDSAVGFMVISYE